MPRPSRWDDIVQAAAEAFREHGYENVTIEDIGNEVGILKGSLYNYITTKEDLLFAVIEKPARDLLAYLRRFVEQEDPDATVTSQLQEFFCIQVLIFAEHYPAAFVYLRHIGRPTHREEFRRMDAEYVAALEALLAKGVERGEFSLPTSTKVAARALVGMLAWMHNWFVPRSHEENLALADEMFALALGGLRSGAAADALTGCEQTEVSLP